MIFNSLQFAVFFPIVFFIYWKISNVRIQNILLLIASYYFYSCWDWRFLFLLFSSTLLCFGSGFFIAKETLQIRKKIILYTSVIINLSILGFFKYYNFFVESFQELFSVFGIHLHLTTLQIILPVGISFYTFHGLSYIIDIYKERIQPTSNFINYSLFVAYFPLLVAGPIERATHLLPQLSVKRSFQYSNMIDGMKQIIWGLFKKILIADNCANYVNLAFENSSTADGATLILAAFLFAIQIYGDFSGYTDIALGVSRMLGIELIQNFKYPYFSRDIAEFWRRWHISLSSWFRDYLYIPLGGSRKGLKRTIINTFIIFLVSGFWHGANWTYIAWGGLHAIYLIPSIIFKKNRKYMNVAAEGKSLPSIRDFLNIATTFVLATLAWIIFRAESITEAYNYLSYIVKKPSFMPEIDKYTIILLLYIIMCFGLEWVNRECKYGIENISFFKTRFSRWCFYIFLILSITLFSSDKDAVFIYFQF